LVARVEYALGLAETYRNLGRMLLRPLPRLN